MNRVCGAAQNAFGLYIGAGVGVFESVDYHRTRLGGSVGGEAPQFAWNEGDHAMDLKAPGCSTVDCAVEALSHPMEWLRIHPGPNGYRVSEEATPSDEIADTAICMEELTFHGVDAGHGEHIQVAASEGEFRG